MLRQLDVLANKHENKGARIFHAAIKRQFDAAASFIEKGGNIDGLVIYPVPLREAMQNFSMLVQIDSAKFQYLDLHKHNPIKAAGIGTGVLNSWYKRVQAWVMVNTGDYIKKINNTTLDTIRSVVAAGHEQGLGARELGRAIRQESEEPFSVYRATVIARTEGTRNASQGHKIGAEAWEKETGQEKWKEWSATNDSRTRDSHRAMLDIHIIKGNEKFTVGGVPMEAPGDPAGGASNCVCCRCRIYYMSERMARKLLGQVAKPSVNPKVPLDLAKYESHTGIKVDKTIFNSLNQITPLINKPGGAYYDPQINAVNIPLRITNKWKDESVVYHEYGHALDWQHGIKEMPEVKQLMDKYRKLYSADNNKLFRKFDEEIYDGGYRATIAGNQISASQHGAIDDTIMSLNYNFGRGHSIQYFQIKGRSEAEFLAHAFENKFIGNPVFKKFAPELYEEMILLIENVMSKLASSL